MTTPGRFNVHRDLCDNQSNNKLLSIDLVLIQILKHCQLSDLLRWKFVNRQWYRCVTHVLSQTPAVVLPYDSQATKELWSSTEYRQYLAYGLKSYSILNLTHQLFRFMPNLQVLILCEVSLEECDVQQLCGLSFMANATLQHLELVSCEFKRFSGLTAQDTWNHFFSSLRHLKRLAWVQVSGSPIKFRPLGLMINRHCVNLEHLTFEKDLFERLRRPDNEWAQVVRRLKSLDLQTCGTRIENGAHAPLDNLQALSICDVCPYELKKLELVAPCLRVLRLSTRLVFDDETLDIETLFPKYRDLIELRLFSYKSYLKDERILQKIARLYGSTLEVLWLRDCCICNQINEKTFAKFIKLREFKHLRTKGRI